MNYEKLLTRLQYGATTVDEANQIIAYCANAISELLEQVPDDRTEAQSSSRWLYLDSIARQMNDAGIDRAKLIQTIKDNAGVNAQNSRETMYHDYWRPVHEALYPNKKRLSKAEIQAVYAAMNNHCANTFGISAAWPDRFGVRK